MRQYLIKEQGVSKFVVNAKNRRDALERTGRVGKNYVHPTEVLPPSSWTQSDFEDICRLTEAVQTTCNVCEKDTGVREAQYSLSAYCGCMGGDPQ